MASLCVFLPQNSAIRHLLPSCKHNTTTTATRKICSLHLPHFQKENTLATEAGAVWMQYVGTFQTHKFYGTFKAVFQVPTSHCTALLETKERKPGGRHAQSKKVGLQDFDEISKAVVYPLFHPDHCNIFKPPDIVALLFCKFYTL